MDKPNGNNNNKKLMKGNEALAEGALLAGCDAYFGYPITPQNEILEYMAKYMPEIGRIFVQAESELAAISMVHGAAAAGKRVLTSSSSPGFSLQQEGVSYMCGAELPCVIVNVQRGGPGLGSIGGAQADYFQATRGGGHGDYRHIALAPSSAQEMMDYTLTAFEKSDAYRNPVLILTDGFIGQAMEPVIVRDSLPAPLHKPWALTGAKDRERVVINSFEMDPAALEPRNKALMQKYAQIEASEVRYEERDTDQADIIIVSYGSVFRSAVTAARIARDRGVKVGLFRPITLYPFAYQRLAKLAEKTKTILVAELSNGQMLEDVKMATANRCNIEFVGRLGGVPMPPEMIIEAIEKITGERING